MEMHSLKGVNPLNLYVWKLFKMPAGQLLKVVIEYLLSSGLYHSGMTVVYIAVAIRQSVFSSIQ